MKQMAPSIAKLLQVRPSLFAVFMALTLGSAELFADPGSEPGSKKSELIPAMEKKFTTPSDEELRKSLTPQQYAVVRENATERPFTNPYWQHREEGIYVDIVTGKPLFSSRDKFDTDCGWPGFAKPIDEAEIKQLRDSTHGMLRVEVRSATGDAHLGHVFNDGPKELGGKRYCINSASLRFIPREKMAEAGYAGWLKVFEAPAKNTAQEKKP
jgi:peptide methionine sulfoxide reductase msrA/msrB